MDRRKFTQYLAGTVISPILGCSKIESPTPLISLPPFSADVLNISLNNLQKAYEDKGERVTEELLPPLSEDQLRRECSWFPAQLPPQIIALYGWHNGQSSGAWNAAHPFWFRDCAFLNIHLAKVAYQDMMSSYGKPEFATFEINLSTCFPFAGFNGGWYVLPCDGQRLDSRFPFPIISVCQGVDIYYYSMELMVETCTDWVSQPDYPKTSKKSEETNLIIWKKHNPGIFSR